MPSLLSKRFLFPLLFILAGVAPLVPAVASAQSAPSVSIQSLSPGSTVAVGNEVVFTIASSGFSSSLSYTLSDSLSGTTASASDINTSNGLFVWIPASNDEGTHTITVTATDGSGASASASTQITVTGPANVSIQSVSPGTSLLVGQTLTFNTLATGAISPTYSVSDSFINSSITAAAINQSGGFTWTPLLQDVGTHTITINVRDSAGDITSATQTVTVVGSLSLSLSALTPSSTVAPGQAVAFTVTPTGLTSPNYTVSDSYGGSSVSNADINSSGSFSWTPNTNDVGTHTITVTGTDSYGHTTSASTQITVSTTGPSLTLSTPSPGNSISTGTTVVFTASPSGFTSPTYSVVDSVSGSTISSNNINSLGSFAWTPTSADIGTHTLTVTAIDSYGHSAATTVQFTVSAAPGVTTTTTTLPTTTSVPAFTFSMYLSPGITSDDVTELQTLLTQQGFFSGPISGYYGPITEQAVIAFQAAHGIDQLGVVGPATRAALNAITAGGTTSTTTSTPASTGDGFVFSNFLDVGSTGTDVTELQERLTTLNLYSGPVTGYFGSLTQAAVMAFQGQHNIEQVGYVGPATRAALNQ